MSADDGPELTSRLTSTFHFITGAWANRRHTRLISSLILAVLPLGAYYFVEGSSRLSADLTVIGILTSISILAFYPLAREVFYRMTQPIAEAFTGFFVIGWLLVLIVFVVRILMYLLIWVTSIPLGILGFFYLAITEARGDGFRFG
ncbi:hypothetical protein SAMN04489751_0344 [Brevibacterium sandarakinum]|uniref:Uncharacterized protein n=1 Tax=Brevibacterium sandarakinum TaxID=629680 RepID=A0A1H1LMD7_BRESA|nr:hypothetical protein [Brevibacterium sandarakinum]SDR75681.1 hypothetical protein SAMN04489751_0344 [Brevibacterium sandarakinum]